MFLSVVHFWPPAWNMQGTDPPLSVQSHSHRNMLVSAALPTRALPQPGMINPTAATRNLQPAMAERSRGNHRRGLERERETVSSGKKTHSRQSHHVRTTNGPRPTDIERQRETETRAERGPLLHRILLPPSAAPYFHIYSVFSS